MTGLTLSRLYYQQIGRPAIEKEFPQYISRIAVGLAGDGSECFGYDDEISRDHDFGPGFCIWLDKNDYESVGEKIQELYESLPKEFMGFSGKAVRVQRPCRRRTSAKNPCSDKLVI